MKFTNLVRNIAKREVVDNYVTGRVISVDYKGKFTIEVWGGIEIKAYNASGQDIAIGDAVAVRLIDGNINKAEIAGKTSRKMGGRQVVFWR